MITGDLNARTGHDQAEVEVMMNYMENIDYNNMDEDEFSRCSKDDTINNFGKSLLNLCFLFDVYILNGFCSNDKEGDFTFVSPNGSSVIDYFLIPCNLLSNFELKVGDCLHSWHLPVEVTWNTMNNQIEGENARQQREEKILWSEENATVYENELESDDFYHSLQRAFEILTVDVNDSLDQFVKALCGAAACMVRRVGQGRKKCNDWFDEECERKKQEVKRLLKRFQRCKTKNDKEEKRKAYTKSRKEYVKLRKTKEQEFIENRLKKIKDSVNDSKTFWTIIRSVNRKSFVYNEIPIQQWHDHFFSVFNDPACNIATDEESITEDEDDCEPLFNSPISNEEVIAAIRHLKSGKSAGPDKIVAEMLKHANTVIIDFLTRLFNQLFENATFPSEWAKSIIIPIHKKGDVNNPDNYRGVALTSIVSKVYTHILNKRLTTWSQREEKNIEEQAGFRANYSTIDHIFTLYSIVQKYLLNKTKLYVAFVDFRKAFDSVNRNALWHVLRKNGINGKLYMALKGVYKSVLACVRVNGIYSDFFDCPNGVKQGCLLSPQMFSFFINELAMELSRKGRHGIQLIPCTLR
eukprot:TRINITY_DN784_c0_g2_i2.p1 TRINITY_DN784_c0_g2~~TRINITY_DN784_c0_g2_i2.p1  ORF type:complete len:579 (+),score=61.48 TRINITY_DN784_c0_g2_i2:324-2060(+)